ncbi:GNAT family N-acetyltransferase [Bacteroidota bacterium]
MEIRAIKENDLPEIQSLQPNDWPDIIYYFELYINSPYCYPICAVKSGKIVGVACSILNNETGWLAHIIVAKEFRRQGIGYKLTETCMNILDDFKCKTQLLIASKEGEMLYPKLGFKLDIHYLYFQGIFNSLSSKSNYIPFNEKHLDSLLDLDYQITGEQRSLLTSNIIKKSILIVNPKSKNVEAYYIPHFGNETIIANSTQAGLELLKYKHSFPNRKSVIPEVNTEAIKFLQNIGFLNYDKCARMYLGEKLKWQPEKVYSRIGGFYG